MPYRFATFAVLACALPTLGVSRAVIDENLRVVPIERVLSVWNGGIEYETTAGSIRRELAGAVLAMTVTDEPGIVPSAGAGWVDLTDGQRVVGVPARRETTDGDTIAWNHDRFGVLWIALDEVRRVKAPGTSSGETRALVPWNPLTDRVLLRNGDTLSGFVLSIGEEIVVELDDGRTTSAIMDLVSTITLANPAADPEGMTVWLADGSVLSAASMVDLGDGTVRLDLAGGAWAPVPLGEVRAIAFEIAALAAVGAPASSSVTTPPDRRWSAPPEAIPPRGSATAPFLYSGDLLVPGPMTLRWSLPEGAVLFGTVAEMNPASFPWGDCEVVVRDGGREVFRAQLCEASPEVEINVPLRSRELEIEIEAGRYGPVLDIVRLRRPMLRVAPE